MKIYIALIRGINVGGHHKLPMAELRKVLGNCGLNNVQTYIQSGNVVFESESTDHKVLEKTIANAITLNFGFEVPVIVKTPDAIAKILDNCPFSLEEKERSYFILLNKVPEDKFINDILNITYEDEQFHIINDCLYFHSSHGYGRTKFNMKTFEKKLQVIGTSRNYKTMLKLLAMSNPE